MPELPSELSPRAQRLPGVRGSLLWQPQWSCPPGPAKHPPQTGVLVGAGVFSIAHGGFLGIPAGPDLDQPQAGGSSAVTCSDEASATLAN